MKFGSVCSGIEAGSVAWSSLGWEACWFAEIDAFPSAVLKHHYPNVPNFGDMQKIEEKIRSQEIEAPDLFCGGTPCQSFSLAGLRKSLDDERGNLCLTFCEIADAIDDIRAIQGKRPSIVLWENVPGVLNSKDNAFGHFLGRLVGSDFPLKTDTGRWPGSGYVTGPKRNVAWRTLDAQHFGVAQRRKRVFVVGCSSTAGVDPSKILFEYPSLFGSSKSSIEEGAKTPATFGSNSKGSSESARGFTQGSFGSYKEGCGTLRASGGDIGGGSETLIITKLEL